MAWSDAERQWMQQALDIARRGEGRVEPNPMVGCVVVADGKVIGQGYHEKFGGPHAEINALAEAGDAASGSTVFVTLEPCNHEGKTPPCVDALISADVKKIVVAMQDPFEGGGIGIGRLVQHGLGISVGLLEDQARDLNAPYIKRIETGFPWVIAKWAMSMDGKIATASGNSQWISNEESRRIVHKLRGRVDAIMVGSGTALADDPLLTARPAGARNATRVIVDSGASLGLESKLVLTANDSPVLIAVGPNADPTRCNQLDDSGCEIWRSKTEARNARLTELMMELASRQFTNVLVEGGGELLGSLRDLDLIDEVHGFLGPMLLGGGGVSPVAGEGVSNVAEAGDLEIKSVCRIDNDIYFVGRRR